MRYVTIDNIKNGDIIVKDVMNVKGAILIPAGFTVKSKLVVQRILNSNDIKFVYVKECGEFNEAEATWLEKKNKEESDELMEVYTELSKHKREMENEILSIINGNSRDTDKLNGIIEETLQIFKSNVSIFKFMQSLKSIDNSIYMHLQNVSLVAYMIGSWIELNDKELDELLTAGLLADVGKMKISEQTLNKTTKLSGDEHDEIQRHTLYGKEILNQIGITEKCILDAVTMHHEMMDGSGYPIGLGGASIPLYARIIAISDVFSALTSDRAYRGKYTPIEALEIMERDYYNKLDRELMLIFLSKILHNFIGSVVDLSDGSVGEIIFIQNNTTTFLVRLENDSVVEVGGKNNKLNIVNVR